MCLGIPMQVLSVDGHAARVTDGIRHHTIDISLTTEAKIGDWLLTFLGAAREVLDPDEAHKIRKALEGLRSLMEGGGLGDAFADLDAREPQLPPHLKAAFDRGDKTA